MSWVDATNEFGVGNFARRVKVAVVAGIFSG